MPLNGNVEVIWLFYQDRSFLDLKIRFLLAVEFNAIFIIAVPLLVGTSLICVADDSRRVV